MSPLTTFLNDRPYVRLRGAAFLRMSETGQVVKGSVVSDAGGGGTTVWTAGTVDIPCRIDALGGGEAELGGAISDLSSHQIMLPPHTEITLEDRFAINGRGTFDVTAIRAQTAEWVTSVEVVQRP